jgi:hypothetical protein
VPVSVARLSDRRPDDPPSIDRRARQAYRLKLTETEQRTPRVIQVRHEDDQADPVLVVEDESGNAAT